MSNGGVNITGCNTEVWTLYKLTISNMWHIQRCHLWPSASYLD